ncbi:MAG TPA: hypothetical protein VMH23_17290 [Bacteroidota bacterium]|nr:hypothetical protein [Bacteroidota bacterium]
MIRPLESSEDFEAFEGLQRDVWGQNLTEVVTASLARIVQNIGGVAAGAFDRRGAMLGLVFGFTGLKGPKPVHWSHLLAVKNSVRDSGLGRRLKLYQRDVLLGIGVEEVYWTYDPLVARNAHLNFNSLGVGVAEYIENMYGPGDDSELFRGLGTDRFVVRWNIASPRVENILAGKLVQSYGEYESSPLVVEARSALGEPLSAMPDHAQRQTKLRIEVPSDIHALRDASTAVAAEWRQASRRAFQELIRRGYILDGFYRDKLSGRCFYCLKSE